MHKNTLKKPNSQLHPNSLSPTRQENTILSFYAAARLLGIISNSHSLHYITNLIYIYIYVIGWLLKGVTILLILGFLILLVFGLEEWIGLGNSSHTGSTSTTYTFRHLSVSRSRHFSSIKNHQIILYIGGLPSFKVQLLLILKS